MNEDELTKIELKKYFETNKNFLSLDTPFENWDSSVILFSSQYKYSKSLKSPTNVFRFLL